MNLRTWGPATVLIVAVAIVVVAVGGLVTIINPDTLTFEHYLDDLWKIALAVAGLAGARGIHLGLAQHGNMPAPPVTARLHDLARARAASAPDDSDPLPHVPAHPGNVPADEGDKGRP